jgi:hypothetical protein
MVSKSKKLNCQKVVKKLSKSGSKAFGDFFVVSRRQKEDHNNNKVVQGAKYITSLITIQVTIYQLEMFSSLCLCDIFHEVNSIAHWFIALKSDKIRQTGNALVDSEEKI